MKWISLLTSTSLYISAAFKATKETFGSLDIVVNNAGVGGETDDNWERCIDINMVGKKI